MNNTTHGEGVVRGIGYAVTYKNVGFSEGFDDYSTARVRLEMTGGEAVATVHTAAAEVGQGLITVEQQICRTELGVERVVVHPKDTSVGSGGSTSASRQTYVTGGAVKAACEAVRAAVLDRGCGVAGPRRLGPPAGRREDRRHLRRGAHRPGRGARGRRRRGDGGVPAPAHARDRPGDGQGDAHVQFAFSAHRAVVDVDVELGLVKVIALDTAQDVGKAINPDAVVGQIHGGSAQGMGLALMEEIVVTDGHVRNPSFTDYLIPTILDMPPMQVKVLEYADPHARTACAAWGSRRPSRPARQWPRRSGPRRPSRCAGCRSAPSTSPVPERGRAPAAELVTRRPSGSGALVARDV